MQKKGWNQLLRVMKNKFFISFLIFAVWIIAFDQHNLIDRMKTKKHLKQLRQDTLYYRDRIQADQQLIQELKTSPANLEKFAREQYLMKAPDEDIFIILKESEIK